MICDQVRDRRHSWQRGRLLSVGSVRVGLGVLQPETVRWLHQLPRERGFRARVEGGLSPQAPSRLPGRVVSGRERR
jgi:hypothetical protein